MKRAVQMRTEAQLKAEFDALRVPTATPGDLPIVFHIDDGYLIGEFHMASRVDLDDISVSDACWIIKTAIREVLLEQMATRQ